MLVHHPPSKRAWTFLLLETTDLRTHLKQDVDENDFVEYTEAEHQTPDSCKRNVVRERASCRGVQATYRDEAGRKRRPVFVSYQRPERNRHTRVDLCKWQIPSVRLSLRNQTELLPFRIVGGILRRLFQDRHIEQVGHGDDQPSDGVCTPEERFGSIVEELRSSLVTLPVEGVRNGVRRGRRRRGERSRQFLLLAASRQCC